MGGGYGWKTLLQNNANSSGALNFVVMAAGSGPGDVTNYRRYMRFTVRFDLATGRTYHQPLPDKMVGAPAGRWRAKTVCLADMRRSPDTDVISISTGTARLSFDFANITFVNTHRITSSIRFAVYLIFAAATIRARTARFALLRALGPR